jgi:hypothetical protein
MVAALTPKSGPNRPAPLQAGLPVVSNTPSRLRVQGVNPRLQSEWLNPGDYRVEILAVKEGNTRPPANRPYFVTEARVEGNTAAERPYTLHPLTGQPKGPPVGSPKSMIPQNLVGHTTSWMVMLDRDGAQRDVRAFLEAAMTPEEVQEMDSFPEGPEGDAAYNLFMAKFTGPEQRLRGRKLLCSADMILTKGKNEPFTKVRWFPDEEEQPGT